MNLALTPAQREASIREASVMCERLIADRIAYKAKCIRVRKGRGRDE